MIVDMLPKGGGSFIAVVKKPTITGGDWYEYDGNPHGPTIVWEPGMEQYCDVENVSGTEPGSYHSRIKLKKKRRMLWDDNTNDDIILDFTIEVVVRKTFSEAADAELATMIRQSDEGHIDLYEDCGWRIGQERQVLFEATQQTGTYRNISWSDASTQPEQYMTMVLLDRGKRELVTPVKSKSGGTRTVTAFDWGFKTCLSQIVNIGYNTINWIDAPLRTWLNSAAVQALPSAWRDLIKLVKIPNADSYDSGLAVLEVTQDYLTLPALTEVTGRDDTLVPECEGDNTSQMEYYTTPSNRAKTIDGTARSYWTRSPRKDTKWGFIYLLTLQDLSAVSKLSTSGGNQKPISPMGSF